MQDHKDQVAKINKEIKEAQNAIKNSISMEANQEIEKLELLLESLKADKTQKYSVIRAVEDELLQKKM